MVKDADFIAEIDKAQAELNPLSGEALQKIVADTLAAPPALVDRMQAMLK